MNFFPFPKLYPKVAWAVLKVAWTVAEVLQLPRRKMVRTKAFSALRPQAVRKAAELLQLPRWKMVRAKVFSALRP